MTRLADAEYRQLLDLCERFEISRSAVRWEARLATIAWLMDRRCAA